MNKFFLILLGIILCTNAWAQNKGGGNISGTIKGGTKAIPLEYATVTIIDTTTGKTITGGATSKDGQFSITDIPAGTYAIMIECIGYKPSRLPAVHIKKNEALDLKTISLAKSDQNLAAVTVTARAKLIDNKIDKLVFNAEQDLTSVGGVATDILKKVPQVSVDVDGNVELAGNASIRILINDKPSTAFGSNMADVLQSIPASQIKNIEVITNPGAKYDAQGMAGIINIILKNNTAKGINGNVSLTAGTRTDNGSFNFNVRNKNFGINAFVSGNVRPKVQTPYSSLRNGIDTTAKTSTLLAQDGNTYLQRHGIQSGLGFDWTYKKHNSFSGSVNYDVFGNNSSGLINQTQQTNDAGGSTLSQILSLNNTDTRNRSHNVDMQFNYKRTFAKEDQELDFSVNSSLGHSNATPNNQQFYMPQDSLYYGIMSNNPGKQNETQIALDYTQPLADKIIFGAGGKTTFMDINSSSSVQAYDPGSKLYQYNSSLSNSLEYHQKIYAAYAELAFPVGKLFDVKAGGRYERTEISTFYSNAQQNVKTPGYNTFVPSVYFSKRLSDGQTIKLSYSKRIERPDYEDLNPFINTSDPKNITSGNPYLLPELGQRVELGYNRNLGNTGSFMVSAFYRHNSQDIQPYVQYYSSLKLGDSTYYNVSVSSRENIGTENNTGINIFTDLRPTPKLSIRSNLAFYHRNIINAIDVGQSRTSFNYRTNLNISYQFNNVLAAEFFGNFNSARNEVQGKYPSLTTYSFAIRKMFWNKKASLALSATNPFNEYVQQKLEIYGSSFTTTTIRKIPFRSIGLNFTWKFGKLEFKKEREQEPADDMGSDKQ